MVDKQPIVGSHCYVCYSQRIGLTTQLSSTFLAGRYAHPVHLFRARCPAYSTGGGSEGERALGGSGHKTETSTPENDIIIL